MAASMLALAGLSANAQLAHYYYAGSGSILNDQVGTANGALETGNGTSLSGGALVTPQNTGAGLSGGVSTGGMYLTGAADAGITGGFTIFDWCLPSSSGSSANTIFSFSDGTPSNMLLATPSDNNGAQPGEYPAHAYSGVAGSYQDLWNQNVYNGSGGLWLNTGVNLSLVGLTYNGTTLSLYIDGAFQQSAAVSGLNLSTLTDIGVAGGSPWATSDTGIGGTTYAFGIFGEALTSSQMSSLYGAGDNASASAIDAAIAPVPEPGTLALYGIGSFALLFMRQRFKR